MQSFKKKREEERKPVNMRDLIKEQRRKFLAQMEEENRLKEEQEAREKKIQKLRGATNNIIEEVSIEDDTSNESDEAKAYRKSDSNRGDFKIAIHERRDDTDVRSQHSTAKSRRSRSSMPNASSAAARQMFQRDSSELAAREKSSTLIVNDTSQFDSSHAAD